MAADGAWPQGTSPEADDATTRRAVDQLRSALGDLESRLVAQVIAPLKPEAVASLTQSLHALSRRMSRHEAASAASFAELNATLTVLIERLDRQAGQQAALAKNDVPPALGLDRTLESLAAVRARPTGPPPSLAPEEPPLIRVLLTAASAAAALSVLGAGAAMLTRAPALPRVAAAPVAAPSRLALRPSLGPAATAMPAGAPIAAAAIASPEPLLSGSRGTPEHYATIAAALERGDTTALPRLMGLAQAGDAQAQLHLASLFETGAPGIRRDLTAARQWTRRAADRGDRVAMHNLGLFLADSGADAEAATWFRRASERGVVDSQYNLGLFYAAGRGVERNLREAYRWFTVAANAGDVAAREKQVELEARLQPAERGALDRDAAAFRPGAQAPALADPISIIPPAETLAETQVLLARKGYYVGAVDGVASPALRAAVTAYLRDHPAMMP